VQLTEANLEVFSKKILPDPPKGLDTLVAMHCASFNQERYNCTNDNPLVSQN